MMRSFFCRILSFVLFVCLSSSAPAAVQWIEAMPSRDAQTKPLLIYFYSHQARPAKVMEEETLKNADISAKLENFVCVRINAIEQAGLTRNFKLIKVPTVVFQDVNGKEIDRAVGYKSPVEFAQYLDRITAAFQASGSTAAAGDGAGTITPFLSAAVDLSAPRPGTHPVVFSIAAPTAKQVLVTGDFNDWRTDANPLTQRGEAWETTLHLPEGAYEYLFFVDGEYRRDMNAKWGKPNPYGALNSVALIGNPKQSPTVQGNTAYFMVYDAKASRIEVAGSFNNWEMFTMFRNPNDPGMWGVAYLNVPPGVHQYKYIIDGTWVADPENYTPSADENGTQNSSFTVK